MPLPETAPLNAEGQLRDNTGHEKARAERGKLDRRATPSASQTDPDLGEEECRQRTEGRHEQFQREKRRGKPEIERGDVMEEAVPRVDLGEVLILDRYHRATVHAELAHLDHAPPDQRQPHCRDSATDQNRLRRSRDARRQHALLVVLGQLLRRAELLDRPRFRIRFAQSMLPLFRRGGCYSPAHIGANPAPEPAAQAEQPIDLGQVAIGCARLRGHGCSGDCLESRIGRRAAELQGAGGVAQGIRASSACASAARTGSRSIRSSASAKKPLTIRRSASPAGRPRLIR